MFPLEEGVGEKDFLVRLKLRTGRRSGVPGLEGACKTRAGETLETARETRPCGRRGH